MILQGIGLVLHDTELILNGPDSGLPSCIDTLVAILSDWRANSVAGGVKVWEQAVLDKSW